MSRADAIGLWWEDHPALKARGEKTARVYSMPSIPDTGWKAPVSFPRLDAANLIAIDLETFDPQLTTHGPGWGRGVGHIVGLAVGTDDGQRWYFPMRHTVGEGNLPPDAVLQWARDEFSRANQPKVFANSQYDLGWLESEGVQVAGDIIDIQIAEPLLDEHKMSYSLDSLAEKYLGEGKVDDALYEWCQRAYGGKPGRTQAGNIYRAPPCLVGPYAEGDVDLPLRIWARQKDLLEQQGLIDLFKLESIIPRILIGMRMKGVRVDIEKAEQAKIHLAKSTAEALRKIKAISGVDVDIWAAESVARAMDKCGIRYPKTAKGSPSFASDWLTHHPSEITTLINDARRYDKAGTTFIDGYILDKHVNGRVHAQYHQLRADDGGTIVGRLSSSMPNLTNIPSRDPEIGKLIRSLWLPEEGEKWTTYDFSQIQFRILAHYASGKGAYEARARYAADPTTDYHNLAGDLIQANTGLELGRKAIKCCNFAIAFSGGKATVAQLLGIPLEDAERLVEQYHSGLPFVKATTNHAAQVAQQRGYIKGILGRKHRFERWEPRAWDKRKKYKLYSDKAALMQEMKTDNESDVVRAFTHLSINRLCQDGEGSHLKSGLVACYKAGLFNTVSYPLAIVHDDINFSTNSSIEHAEALTEMKHLLESAIKWKVPMICERGEGASWGDVA
jgi:DNA polymerase I-like protein with 3'-5' exonuclease and polymerase domains